MAFLFGIYDKIIEMPYKDKHNPKLLAYQREYQKRFRKTAKYKKWLHEYLKKNAKRIRLSIKQWQKTKKGKLSRNRYQTTLRYVKGDSIRNRDLIYKQVKRAVECGKLVKGLCEVCKDDKVHAHHEDYSKPLQVRWLCARHHRYTHIGKGFPE